MTEFNHRIASLIIKDLQGLLSVEESKELQDWLNESAENRFLYNEFKNDQQRRTDLEEFYIAKNAVWEKLQHDFSKETVVPIYRHRVWRSIVAAIFILGILSAGLYFLVKNRSSKEIVKTEPAAKVPSLNDIKPGSNKATLTLTNGSLVILDNAKTGNLTTEQGFTIVKLNDGELAYRRTSEIINPELPLSNDLPYNTITTPRGGQYHVVLGDGTKVWLNAASSISYPLAFSGQERKVTITGEVYFEVASIYSSNTNNKVPFIVQVVNNSGKKVSEVEVLGTHFNINGYDDEAAVKTTLLEGSVKVRSAGNNQSVIIKPGQQAIVTPDNALKTAGNINTEEIMAWKNGLFEFKSVGIETIMRQAARWYDLNVEYQNEKPTDKFTGKISRNVNLSQLLKILELSEVHFTLRDGKTLVITRNE